MQQPPEPPQQTTNQAKAPHQTLPPQIALTTNQGSLYNSIITTINNNLERTSSTDWNKKSNSLK